MLERNFLVILMLVISVVLITALTEFMGVGEKEEGKIFSKIIPPGFQRSEEKKEFTEVLSVEELPGYLRDKVSLKKKDKKRR